MKFLIFLVSMITLTSCYQTENGIAFGKPSYENREIKVTEIDLEILERTNELLSEGNWSKDSVRICSESENLSLYCALERASIEVNGEYKHRQAALQEVRFAIDDHYRSYWSKHRLGDFNGNNLTTFYDIKKVIAVAMSKIQSKLKHNKSIQPSAWAG